jgi:hypothetical protein
MSKKLIIFRGYEVSPNWPNRLRKAQLITTIKIDDVELPRIKYGEEHIKYGEEHNNLPCHDCCAILGEYHVPGCDVERCPNCCGQLISCSCVEG